MSAVKIAENVYWVGAIDYDVREFHGYKTPYGTTYNAYLILDDKITLIDTVKASFAEEMIKNVEEIIPFDKIDYLISNHVEPDHSGSLVKAYELAKDAVVYTSPNGEKGLRAYYKKDFNFHVTKTGETLNTGKYSFTFIHTPMVHWPDNMVTFMPEQNILFSNDAFGQHIASKERFADELGKEKIMERAGDYYANIVFPFGMQVKRILDAVKGLEIKQIAPSHGVVWRTYLDDILAKYAYWADNKFDENSAVIVYDTMWNATKIMAERLAEDFKSKGIKVKLLSLKEHHISEVMTEILEAKYICVGSSTLNRNMLPNVAAFLTYMKGLSPKGRTGLAFGSYGWSGESIPQIEEILKSCGFEMLPSIKQVYMP